MTISAPESLRSGQLPRWDAENRDAKGKMILRTIERFGSINLNDAQWVDLGCGSGGIAATLAPHVKSIIGLDPEPWPFWDDYTARYPNLSFQRQSVEDLALPDGSTDVVICNQVYEHVPDPQRLIREIHRILRPGGICYFAGPNLLFPIEPHRLWPFVHWLPRNTAVRLMGALGAKKVIDANSVSYWTLLKWLKPFEVTNVLQDMVADPQFYGIHGRAFRLFTWLPHRVVAWLTWISPAFIFIVRKPT